MPKTLIITFAVFSLLHTSLSISGGHSFYISEAMEIETSENFIDSPTIAKEIHRLEKLYPDTSGKDRYGKSGHQYTTYIVANLALQNRDRAYEMAYYSQFPDKEIRFSATLAFFYIFDLDYRKKLMAVLHSLHGGNDASVNKRRADLFNLIDEGIRSNTLEDYQIGLIIHAYADSFAHTTESEDGNSKAFDYSYGHLFHGHKPDVIAHAPDKYKSYTCGLFKALSQENDCLKLKKLHEMIDRLEKSRNSELPEFEKYAKNHAGFDTNRYEALSEEWSSVPIKKDKVVETIEKMEVQFSL